MYDQSTLIQREDIRSFEDARALIASSVGLPRTQGRTKEQREDWCISRFIYRQLSAGLCDFPVVIERPGQDPPDFLLSIAGGAPIAVEVRDAGPAPQQRAATALERAAKGTFLVEGRLVAPGMPIGGRGWPGREPQEAWARHIWEAILGKPRKLPTQPPAARFELLLYDQTHAPVYGEAELLAAAALVERVPPVQMPTGPRSFDRVSVISDPRLLLDVYGSRQLLDRPHDEPA